MTKSASIVKKREAENKNLYILTIICPVCGNHIWYGGFTIDKINNKPI